MVYYRFEPFGELQGEYRMGMIASTVANTARDEKKKRDPFAPSDFMRPEFLDQVVEPEEEIDEETREKKLWSKIQVVFAAFARKKKEPNGNSG